MAQWQRVDRSTMTAQINRLERLGLVERAQDPADRRAVLVHATEAGRALHQSTLEAARHLCDVILEGWTEEETQQLNVSLGRLVDELERLTTSGDSL